MMFSANEDKGDGNDLFYRRFFVYTGVILMMIITFIIVIWLVNDYTNIFKGTVIDRIFETDYEWKKKILLLINNTLVPLSLRMAEIPM